MKLLGNSVRGVVPSATRLLFGMTPLAEAQPTATGWAAERSYVGSL